MTKVPRFTFEKFPGANEVLTTQMKSVGEVMAIGRTFKESLQKALRGLEIKRFGIIGDGADKQLEDEELETKLSVPNAERIFWLGAAFAKGWDVEKIFALTKIDRWFLRQIEEIVKEHAALAARASTSTEVEVSNGGASVETNVTVNVSFEEGWVRRAKRLGFSDHQLSVALQLGDSIHARQVRKALGIIPTYRLVDTCAAEFEA